MVGLPQVSRYVDKAQVKTDGVSGIEPDKPRDRAPFGTECFGPRRLHRGPSPLRHCLIEQVTADVEPGKAHADPEYERSRHPQPLSDAWSRMVVVAAPTADPKSTPAQAPNGPKLPRNPRCPGFDRSTRKIAEVVYSPPTESPCRSRSNTSSAAAVMPI